MWRDTAWLADMVISGRMVLEYVQGIDQDEFVRRKELQDMVMRRLTIIGQATKNVSEETRSAHPEVEWRTVDRFRDLLVHHYFRIDLDRVCDIVQTHVPALIAALEPLIPPEEA
jgi:uncharacterized protein with HEPN domain